MSSAAYAAAKAEKLKALKKKTKSLPILVMESTLYEWNPGRQMTLMVIALGRRSNPEAWIQEDCPLSAEEAIGWCDMSQWRIAQRAKKSESAVHRDIKQFEKDGVVRIEGWDDENGTHHAMYKVNEAVLWANQRKEHKKHGERAPRYKTKNPNRGRFTSKNQPTRSKIEDADDE